MMLRILLINRCMCLFLFVFAFGHSYSQTKVERCLIDSAVYEVIEDTATFKPSLPGATVKIRVGVFGDFYKDSLRVAIKSKVLMDTLVSTRYEEGKNEADNCYYTQEMKIEDCCPKIIEFVLNRKKMLFKFKPGYSIIYFSFYDETDSDGIRRMVYSVNYTNEYRIRL